MAARIAEALVILIFVSVMLLISHAKQGTDYVEEGEHWFETVDRSSDVKVIRHRETGVCYITTGYDTEPLLRSDGSLYILGE